MKIDPATGQPRERRYGTGHWRAVRLQVLQRDGCCWVPSCAVEATVADHIAPVYPGMPDDEFYGLWNLRASCKRHNTARGVAARLARETVGLEEADPSPRRWVPVTRTDKGYR